MAIPDFQTIMLPVLRYMADGGQHATRDAIASLADQFKLTDHERAERLKSGPTGVFANRVGWAVSYLKQAAAIESPERGRYVITDRGREILTSPPERITIAYLAEVSPEFRVFRAKAGKRRNQKIEVPTIRAGGADDDERTPEEQIDAAERVLRAALEHDLLDRVKRSTPDFFERIVLELLLAMGYGGTLTDAGEQLGRTGDDGVDGVIKEDKLGLEAVHLQAKRWVDKPVSRPDVQSFAGSLEGQRSRKGVFITTSYFTSDAKDYVRRIEKRIVLIDGQELAKLMIDHGVGVTEVRSFSLLRLNETYFEDEA